MGVSTLHKSARIGALVSFIAILIGSFFGRLLQNTFPSLVVLIPYVGVLLLIVLALALLRFLPSIGASIVKSSKQPERASLYKVAFGIALIALLLFVGESLIAFPIERVHLIKYSALGFCVFFSQRSDSAFVRLSFAVSFSSLLGAGEEILQFFHPARFFDWRDIILNTVASLIGGLLAWTITLICFASIKDRQQSLS